MMMKKMLLTAGALLLAAGVAGCGQAKETLKIYNAGKYIDRSVLEDFEKENNVRIVYDEFDSNENMYVKVANDAYTYDVVVPSDYMIDRLKKENRLAALDHALIPNLSNIQAGYLDPSYDPGNRYSVPYMVGTLGILYNTSMVEEEIDSWGALWNSRYANRIFMWDSMRDVIGAALKYLGYSMNSENDAELAKAKQLLLEQRPLVQAYISDEMADKMIAGEGALGLIYSGDAIAAMAENEDLAYVVPKEGSNQWTDAFVVLKTAKQPELAQKFINYMCSPEIAARNMEETGYTSPVKGAATGEMLEDEAMFPTEATLETCEQFIYSVTGTEKFSKLWLEITTAK